jgi:hypothetical protein
MHQTTHSDQPHIFDRIYKRDSVAVIALVRHHFFDSVRMQWLLVFECLFGDQAGHCESRRHPWFPGLSQLQATNVNARRGF